MLLLQDAVSGLGAGAAYALVALAVMMVYRSTTVMNFAQGEMATFTTFISWDLLALAHISFYWTMLITCCIAAAVGVITYALVLNPAQHSPHIVTVMLTFAMTFGLVVWLDTKGSGAAGSTTASKSPTCPVIRALSLVKPGSLRSTLAATSSAVRRAATPLTRGPWLRSPALLVK